MTETIGQAAIDSTLLTVVRTTAAGLAGAYGFSLADCDDIRQELLLDCLVRLRKFDRAKSSRRTFLHRVVRHRVATLLNAQRAACRDYRRCRASLDGAVHFEAGGSVVLGETVSAADYEVRTDWSVLSTREREQLRIDVSKVIGTLPPELAAIATLLKSVNATEAAHQPGLPLSTLYRRIAVIREVFKSAGLNLYIGWAGRIGSRRQPLKGNPHGQCSGTTAVQYSCM